MAWPPEYDVETVKQCFDWGNDRVFAPTTIVHDGREVDFDFVTGFITVTQSAYMALLQPGKLALARGASAASQPTPSRGVTDSVNLRQRSAPLAFSFPNLKMGLFGELE